MYDAMVNLIQRTDPTVFSALLLVFGFAFGVIIVSSIVYTAATLGKHSRELGFKREMLVRGIPAAEIEQALRGSTSPQNVDSGTRETMPYRGM
jgi:hypothetical protein